MRQETNVRGKGLAMRNCAESMPKTTYESTRGLVDLIDTELSGAGTALSVLAGGEVPI